MGWLSRLGRSHAPEGDAWPAEGAITAWPDGDTFRGVLRYTLFEPASRGSVEVVGEAAYQGTLEVFGGGRTIDGVMDRDHLGVLIPEPANPYDPDAIRAILVDPSRSVAATVGYLSRENAREYRSAVDRMATFGRLVACRASLRGGWERFGGRERGSIGVRLYLPPVDELNADVGTYGRAEL